MESRKQSETKLARPAGFPRHWVNNLAWIDFCSDFFYQPLNHPQQTLTRRLLPKGAEELRSAAEAAVKGHEATLQAHHLIAYMISADGKVGKSCSY